MGKAAPPVLERKVIHAGNVFIKAGEENSRAYMIQTGKVRSFMMRGDSKVEVAQYGPGTIIGEVCLVMDDPINVSYEALVDTTVAMITRPDFQKKLQRVDKTVVTILDELVKKITARDKEDIAEAVDNADIDSDAHKFVQALVTGLAPGRKALYETTLLPHMNRLIHAIKELKKMDSGSASG
jgi:CRP-like cAMP-binding protein